ncbi:MAG: UDP-N-acetylmuramoylalanine--D-glutamate ligase [Planctomycetota bacterium]|jgi:UDP-N-acetylmuramoylalanine--D-glutamate ligase
MTNDPALPAAGTNVLVHGLGRFGGGREATRHLLRQGCNVVVCDGSRSDELLAVQASFGPAKKASKTSGSIDWQLGREDLALLDDIDLVVTSPAVPDHNPLRQEALARGIPCTQECELFLAAYPGRVVAITGTNGKSTTATLLHRALRAADFDSLLGGNIGHSLLADVADWQKEQVAVLEVSSFQLERFAAHRRVYGAVFTRMGSDHIDRHGTLANYHAAKARLAEVASGFVLHAADDPVANAFTTDAKQRGYFSTEPPGPGSAGIEQGYARVRKHRDPAITILHQDALRLLGDFQVENVLAASLAAIWLGADAHRIGLSLATAAPLPFRLQLLTTVSGVQIYDNGVSTQLESTRQALMTLAQDRRVHWLGGGKSKDGDHRGAAEMVALHAASAHVFGAAAKPMAALSSIPTTSHESLREALPAALAAARPGDAVLFSPAFASFDQYPNFRARALEFHSLLRERRAATTTQG